MTFNDVLSLENFVSLIKMKLTYRYSQIIIAEVHPLCDMDIRLPAERKWVMAGGFIYCIYFHKAHQGQLESADHPGLECARDADHQFLGRFDKLSFVKQTRSYGTAGT